MAKSKSEILDDFQAFMGKHGGNYKEWYVSTSSNPKMDLTKYHKIKNGDKGLFRTAESDIRSAEVAEFFTDLGAKGDSGIKDDAICVYAFKMDKHTRPNR
ncbi:MAG: hypothetical protein GKS03_03680 [Alphaproteobacteria bacterium]|nr:hypothetical protein [Alphaproteobacteria bacterium]